MDKEEIQTKIRKLRDEIKELEEKLLPDSIDATVTLEGTFSFPVTFAVDIKHMDKEDPDFFNKLNSLAWIGWIGGDSSIQLREAHYEDINYSLDCKYIGITVDDYFLGDT